MAEAAYNSEWESYANKDLRDGLQLMMLQARNTPKFSAGYIIDLDLGNFVNVCIISSSNIGFIKNTFWFNNHVIIYCQK